MTTLKHRVEYSFFKTLLLILKYTPARLASKLGSGLGSFCYLTGIRRSVVEQNLEIAFGDELNKAEQKKLCRRVYKNVGSVMLEFLKLNSISPKKIHNYIEMEGVENLREAIKQGKGVVLGGFHFGNWEIASAGLCSSISPVYAYAGKQKNQLIDNAINNIRQKFGMTAISKHENVGKEMVKILKQNNIIGIISDINVPHDHLFVDFFNVKAAMGPGLGVFVYKLQAPLFIVWNERVGTFKYKGYIKKIDYQLTGDSQKDVGNISQLYSSALEEIVRKNPDHYFWVNRRWKTRPQGEEDIY